jgi:hypothetical protein
MASFEFLAIILTGLGLIASILYYASILSNANRTQRMQLETRQANVLMSLHSEWGRDEYQKAVWTVLELDFDDFDDFVDKYGPVIKNTEVNRDIFKVCWFFNGLGSLVHKGFASLELVNELFGYMAIWVWDILEPIIVQERILFDQPKSLEWFEYLYRQLQPLNKPNTLIHQSK